MPKKTKETTAQERPATEEPKNTEAATVENDNETALATLPPEDKKLTTAHGLEGAVPEFLENYRGELKRLDEDLPSKTQMQQILLDLPEHLQEKMMNIYRTMSGKKRGAIGGEQNDTTFLQLRLYHGVGSDPMRPEDLPVGNFYSSAGIDFGKEVICTPLAYTKGRALLGDRNRGEDTSRPICSSWDRKMGNTYGKCENCPYRPWKDGQPNRCSNDILFYLLDKDLTGIYTLRFSKTSESGGRQLAKLAGTTMDMWSRWYRVYAEKTKSSDGKQEYRVLKASPYTGGDNDGFIPEALDPVCAMLCDNIVAKTILPRIHTMYQDGVKAQAEEDEGFSATPEESEDFGKVDGDSLNSM